ncbi:MAG: PhoH family protein [Candidatus Eisenbacteria bacterium]|uniref:PhoH family protein n=1 Tax=Eiseniibacteriota bacterium TaxID=2212470 RepID=A0A7Y2EAX5_UNCEI|nr:PhoH family protein [Candidatus Eisenbacteria bacterium]
MQKTYILDTNVLLHDPHSLNSFQDNEVLVPIYVIEEIDQFKRQASELGSNARLVSRILDGYRNEGNLAQGVTLEGGGHLRVVTQADDALTSLGQKPAVVDNALLKLAVEHQEATPDRPVVLVTKDTNLRIKADALGIRAEDYETDRIELTDLYRGVDEIVLPEEDVEELKNGNEVNLPDGDFYPNEYVWLRADMNNGTKPPSALGRIDLAESVVRPLELPGESVSGVRPRNKEQYFALDALLDPDIALVTLMGKAGTGKTLLALAAGLHQVREQKNYTRLMVARPVFPMGRDLGYLPGEIEEKLNPWMQPIYDNLEFLIEHSRKGTSIRRMIDTGVLGLEAITYIRGRSIPGQYLVVDESQNLTPLEVKTIITRVGEGTKIVLTGDPHQIDNPYVDVSTNGFNHLVQRFRPEAIAAHIELLKGERSRLAELATDLL